MSKLSSHKPISLLCVASKLVDAIIRNRMQFALNQSLFLSQQYTACPGILASHAVAHILEVGRTALRRQEHVVIACINVGGVFNNIDHAQLIANMQEQCMGNLALWILQWLEGCSIVLHFEEGSSAPHDIIGKCKPQGLSMSALLWCIHIDSLF